MNEESGGRAIDAAEANRLASELDGMPFEATPVEDSGKTGTAQEGTTRPLEKRDPRSLAAQVFPPDIDENETIGATPEEEGVLREETSR